MALKDIFSSASAKKIGKGALAGAGIAIVTAAVLPVVTVSLPVVAVGAAAGAYINNKMG